MQQHFVFPQDLALIDKDTDSKSGEESANVSDYVTIEEWTAHFEHEAMPKTVESFAWEPSIVLKCLIVCDQTPSSF